MSRRQRSSKRTEPTDVLDEVSEQFRDLVQATDDDEARSDSASIPSDDGERDVAGAAGDVTQPTDSAEAEALETAGLETVDRETVEALLEAAVLETAQVVSPAKGTPASDTPASGTPANDTPANDTPANDTVDEPTSSGPTRRSRSRAGGRVAPFVEPPSRYARWRSLQGWRRQGFVPLSPGREKRRHRILPRSVIGICTMLMSAGIGAGFAGAGFYAYYDDRLAENEAQVAGFVETFDTQFSDAALAIEGQRDAALEDVRAELLPLEAYVSDANGVSTLPDTAGPSIWSVRSLDDNGVATSGSAFAVIDHQGGTGLITQLDIVRSGIVAPGPPIELVKGDRVIQATLWTWDEVNGLALIVTSEVLPLLDIADVDEADLLLGRSVFAVSGFGARGATASPGLMLDRSVQGLQHTAALGPVFNGGPILDGFGRVLGMTTSEVAPEFGDIKVAVDASTFCQRVLRCVNGFEAGTN